MKFVLNYVLVYAQDHCCGVNYYTDWRNTKYGARRVYVVPDSCCKTNEYACGYQFKPDDINRRVSFVLLIVVLLSPQELTFPRVFSPHLNWISTENSPLACWPLFCLRFLFVFMERKRQHSVYCQSHILSSCPNHKKTYRHVLELQIAALATLIRHIIEVPLG